MNLFADIRAVVLTCLDGLVTDGVLPSDLSYDNVSVEPPRDASHGDMATNAAMVLAKPAKSNPRVIADALAAKLLEDPRITEAEVAGPGFLNMRLGAAVWQGVVKAAVTDKTYGQSDLGQGQTMLGEDVSANPTGPLHVGHTRGAVFGDALASLLDYAGYDVTREYYINDGGAQVDVLARSVYLRYQEAHGLEVAFPEGTYPGDYLVAVGEALKVKVGSEYLEQSEAAGPCVLSVQCAVRVICASFIMVGLRWLRRALRLKRAWRRGITMCICATTPQVRPAICGITRRVVVLGWLSRGTR
jgi:arginyl-tRNA synthetase